jgi:hypothetical protein
MEVDPESSIELDLDFAVQHNLESPIEFDLESPVEYGLGFANGSYLDYATGSYYDCVIGLHLDFAPECELAGHDLEADIEMDLDFDLDFAAKFDLHLALQFPLDGHAISLRKTSSLCSLAMKSILLNQKTRNFSAPDEASYEYSLASIYLSKHPIPKYKKPWYHPMFFL